MITAGGSGARAAADSASPHALWPAAARCRAPFSSPLANGPKSGLWARLLLTIYVASAVGSGAGARDRRHRGDARLCGRFRGGETACSRETRRIAPPKWSWAAPTTSPTPEVHDTTACSNI